MLTVPASVEHVPSLLDRIGHARRSKMAQVAGSDPTLAIVANIGRSRLTWCGLDDGGVVTIGGVIPTIDPNTGYVWQFITPAVAENKRAYIMQGRRMMEAGLQLFQKLTLSIEVEYKAALRHAARNGWTILPEIMISGVLVHPCEKAR